MEFLDYIRLYQHRDTRDTSSLSPISIQIITNFTDDILAKVLGGRCLSEGYVPTILQAPYKQYHLVLKDSTSPLYASTPDISFVFFDINPYLHNEFLESPHHIDETIADVRAYCETLGSTVVLNLALLPHRSAYGHFYTEDPTYQAVKKWNDALITLTSELPNVFLFDPNILQHTLGETRSRDLRGSYAFDMPFSNEFVVALTSEWLANIRALTGRARKCLVLDLDQTLWGGIVGEVGATGIALGPTYPGVAFQNFQRTLLKLWERGVILAINSKNNLDDVLEVFQRNPHVILRAEHFAAIRANWDDKSDNIASIAAELNIGTDSMVFLDDSPLERERMRAERPEVLVPEFSLPPEQYVPTLLSLNVFHQMSLTQEDREKGRMYAAERARKEVLTTVHSKKDYIATLGITVAISASADCDLARVAQLTQKTNQFNLTTRRYAEADIRRMLERGWRVYSAEVADKFGSYGIVIVAIVDTTTPEAILDTFLMSCRVMGRDVEYTFLERVCNRLRTHGVTSLTASFVPTAKNAPAADFLPTAGFTEVAGTATRTDYRREL